MARVRHSGVRVPDCRKARAGLVVVCVGGRARLPPCSRLLIYLRLVLGAGFERLPRGEAADGLLLIERGVVARSAPRGDRVLPEPSLGGDIWLNRGLVGCLRCARGRPETAVPGACDVIACQRMPSDGG